MIPRTLGETVPISIGSAIPFEEVILAEDIVLPPALLINVRTLFRNFWGAWANIDRPPIGSIWEDFILELEYIRSLCINQHIELNLYWPLYKDLKVKFPDAKLVEPSTPGQLKYREAEETCLMHVRAIADLVDVVDMVPLFNPPKALMVTSFPLDLIMSRIPSLELLESHTGAVKQKYDWFSKLSKDDTVQHFPFNLFTLQVYGDKSTLFKAMPKKLRDRIQSIGLKKTWSIMTTYRDIRRDLVAIEEKDLRELALRLCASASKTRYS